jgi:predicted RNA-binding protein with PIN domain
MLQQKIVRPDGSEYMTAVYNREDNMIEFHNFGSHKVVVKFDAQASKQLSQFLREVEFVKFCEGEKK